MDSILQIVKSINNVLWSYLLIFLLCGTGIMFTVMLKGVQVTRFMDSVRRVFHRGSRKGQADSQGMNSFQSLATAVAAQVGTGNLAGAATAIAAGGPGAIFWMWVTAFFGMATIFAEAVLAQIYKEDINGEVRGGPAFYISKGLKCKGLAVFFSITIIIALGFVGNMVQANSIGEAFNEAFGISPVIMGAVTVVIAGLIFRDGVKQIASFTEKIVPFMAVLYMVGGLYILLSNLSGTIHGIEMIFVGAFNPKAATGGLLGVGVKQAVRYGVARGLFSNEAGMGSTPHAHAIAKVRNPIDQGIVAMFGVFFDTFIILTITALIILSNVPIDGKMTGISLTQFAFKQGMGQLGTIFVAVALFFFAFSTIIGWYFFGEANIRYLFSSKKSVNIYSYVVLVFIFLGCLLKVELVWELADMFNGLMVLPNIIALIGLSGIVKKGLEEYNRKEGSFK